MSVTVCIDEITSELSDHALVILHCLQQDLLGRVHLPAPLGAHGVGVVSAGRRDGMGQDKTGQLLSDVAPITGAAIQHPY